MAQTMPSRWYIVSTEKDTIRTEILGDRLPWQKPERSTEFSEKNHITSVTSRKGNEIPLKGIKSTNEILQSNLR